MRVCYFGAYERNYPRNRVIIEGLSRAGVEVIECHRPLWELTRDKSRGYLSTGSLLRLSWEVLRVYLRLARDYSRVGGHDLIMVGYIGQMDVLLARMLTVFKRKPIVFNPLVSLYDTLVEDRGRIGAGSLRSRLLFFLDKWSCRLSDLILLDTQEHIRYFSEGFGIPPERFRRLWVGAEERVFSPNDQIPDPKSQIPNPNDKIPDPKSQIPLPHPPPHGGGGKGEGEFKVLFYGKLSPLHGIIRIIEAAGILRQSKVHFTIIGTGQLSEEVRELAGKMELKEVELVDWVEYQELPLRIKEADVCLGVFGDGEKAGRVIPNKVFQALAMGKPVISGDSPGARELLTHGRDAWLCERGSAEAIAEAILKLKGDPELCRRLGEEGRRLFRERCSTEVLGREIKVILEEMQNAKCKVKNES
jgi:glycosyltransferase involved in cell wall biosynthesis